MCSDAASPTVPDPTPVPSGMSEVAVITMTIREGEWREQPAFRCVQCGGNCFLHPHTNQIWGCPSCGFTTASVSIYFVPAPSQSAGTI